jgi:hypothetical protein
VATRIATWPEDAGGRVPARPDLPRQIPGWAGGRVRIEPINGQRTLSEVDGGRRGSH